MKARLHLLSLALLLSIFVGAGPTLSHPRYLVRISLEELKSHLAQIRHTGVDVAGVNIPRGTADLIADSEQLAQLSREGVAGRRNPTRLVLDAPDAKFKTPEQVAQILAGFQKTYPELARVESIGKSAQGRDILALRITENAGKSAPSKPAILFNGMHHAREVMSTEVPLDIAEYLLSHYGSDSKVTHWLDSNVIYVLPMLNVDGNNLVWTQDSMWRKNSRGVDINRNYPYKWNGCGGSSDASDAQDYHGPSAASEPETNVLMNFVKSVHPVFDISFHSYSELVIYPYGCGQHTETADVVEPLGKQLASLIPSDTGSGTYTAGLAPELLYTVDGDDISWMYHDQHVIPFVIELNSDEQGFQPSYDDWRDKTVTKLRPAWQLLLDRLDHSTIRGQVNLPAGARPRVRVQGLGAQSEFRQTYPVRPDGSFFAVVNPGDYRVTVEGAGMNGSRSGTVRVGDGAARLQFFYDF